MSVKVLKPYINGEFIESKAKKYADVTNSSTGEVMAQTPISPVEEVEYAVQSAANAYHDWSETPALKRIQVLYKLQQAMTDHLDELAGILAREEGKVFSEARGDVLKGREAVEFATNAPTLLMGESSMDTSSSIDTVLYRHPVGVFASIIPFNFPAMIPMQLMAMCIATGNTVVIKAATNTPMTGLRIMELLDECGLPKGVVNMFTCSRTETDMLLRHPAIKGVSFIGSTAVGKHIYEVARSYGKRVQCMMGAKNHCLVLEDCDLERSVRGIVAASYGCAGQRCMALPVVCVQESIADKFVALTKKYAQELVMGQADDPTTTLGPVVTAEHQKKVLDWIEVGIKEGAKLVLDGRHPTLPADCAKGFFIGPTIFDHVTEDMSVGREEIFGPVMCIKRVKNFEEGMQLCNASRYANGMAIYTNSGYYSRRFAKLSHSGQIGINVGIPVTPAIFPFTGQKESYMGDIHNNGKDGARFYTELKTVTTRWFDEEERKNTNVGTWDGMMTEK